VSEEETIPPAPVRRAADGRIDALERNLAENTRITADQTVRLDKLAFTVDEIKVGNDSLLEMKDLVERHIAVMCTWARWFKRGAWGLLSLAGVVLPVVVGLKQLGVW
jgi:hypothetical protein